MTRQSTNSYCQWVLRLVLAVMCAGLLPAPTMAVPALGDFIVLKQPDGTGVKARQWGDESLHGWETADGYAIVFDEARKSWAYAERGTDGGLQSSGKLPGKDAAPAIVGKRLRPSEAYRTVNPIKRLSREGKKPSFSGGKAGIKGLSLAPQFTTPTIGAANIPVILINFLDTTTTYTTDDFTTLLFSSGNYSMKDYYDEVSYGQFSVSPGPAGVTGWFTAGHPYTYYGLGRNEKWTGTLVREAVAAADATVDFSAYDMDGDCYVDVVDIVHQGTGQEASGIENDIWSHRWSLKAAYFYGLSDGGEYTTNDICRADPSQNVKVNDYVIQPEIFRGGLTTMGVFAHEYGHALGLPDLYDSYDDSSEGAGVWSIMASGSWNRVSRPGDRPGHFDAWSKYFLGWMQPARIDNQETTATLHAASSVPDLYQLLFGYPGYGEYYLLENRQQSGFDVGLPGSGLLIWHIDDVEDAIEHGGVNVYECLPPADCSHYHYAVQLVQADNNWDLERNVNRGDAGDPYSATNNSAFTETSLPASVLNSRIPYTVRVTNVSESGPTMTASLLVSARALVINGPDSVLGGTSATFSVTMNDDNGDVAAVSPTWSVVTTGNLATLDSAGVLTVASVPMDQPFTIQAEYFDGVRTLAVRKTITLVHLISLVEALDYDTTFLTGGDAVWAGQKILMHDGVDAAQSGTLQNGQSSWLETTVMGPGKGSFYWKVSSELMFDVMQFTIDGSELQHISGEVDWKRVDFTTTGNGPHTLRWQYSKDQNLSRGSDAAWLDQFSFASNVCGTLSMSPTSGAFSAAENTGTITVTADPACNWHAVPDATWISITSGASGTGNGTVAYRVLAGVGAARTSSITAEGNKFTIMQTTRVASDHDGDLDGGGVSMLDAQKALRISAGLATATDYELLHGDVAPEVNGISQPDGKIDINDVSVILQRAKGL